MNIKAHITVVFDHERRVDIDLSPARVLFEESCIIYGFKPVNIGVECEVIAIVVDGQTASCNYNLGEKDTFIPGAKFYYPSMIAQFGKETSAEPETEIERADVVAEELWRPYEKETEVELEPEDEGTQPYPKISEQWGYEDEDPRR